MLIMLEGTKKGDTLRGPPFSSVSYPFSMPGSPPIPEPMQAPIRSALASVTSRSASSMAWMLATNP